MDTINVYEAKTHLSRLLERVEHGESITISRAGRPIALLCPLQPPARRTPGTDRIVFSDDFDAPLPDFAEYTLPAPGIER
jgi:prevent-host-death family protein